MPQKSLLELKNLSIAFQLDDEQKKGIENISFQLHENETLAIVGESGSGKSITSLAIMDLLPQPPAMIHGGEIYFLGQNLLLSNGKNTYRGKEIAMIFQEPMSSLNPLISCGEQVIEALLRHEAMSKQEAKEKCLQLFEEVQLPQPEIIFKKYPHQISGGQKQRVMIAMALSCNPKILIADEPTTALDVSVQKVILDLLKTLQNKYQLGIIFITHDLNLVKHYADTVLVLNKGNQVEYASCEKIFSQPQEKYTQGLLHSKPKAQERLERLPQVDDFLEDKIFDKKIISNTAFQNHLTSIAQKEIILELKNVSSWYAIKKNLWGKTKNYFKALNQVSLQLHKGESIGILGESGCGKTTLGKTIVGLAEISEGEIRYQGKSIQHFSKSEKEAYTRAVQIIFQDPYSSLNPRLSIGKAISEVLEVHKICSAKERKELSIHLLEQVGLQADVFERYPHEFSGGQRQRICIARALAVQPKILICDESVSALDVSVQAQVLNLLSDLRQQFDLSYIFISHDIAVVKHISDRIAVMKNGFVEEMQDAEKLYHHPLKSYTQNLIKDSLLE